MTTADDKLRRRLEAYADSIKLKRSCVISVKLRPVRIGAKCTDVLGLAHSNAYMYGSEYQAGRDTCPLRPTQDLFGQVDSLYIQHPSRDNLGKFMWLFDLPNSKTVWIQHETGLETLTIVKEIADVAQLLYKVYEAIRKRVRKNTKSENTDRHWKGVDKIRLEVRRLDASGNLEQRLIVCHEIDRSFDPMDYKTLIEVINSPTGGWQVSLKG